MRPTVIYHHTILLFNTLVIGWLGLCFLLALIALGLAVTFTKTTLTEANAIVASGTLNYHRVSYNITTTPVPVLAITSAAITILTLPTL